MNARSEHPAGQRRTAPGSLHDDNIAPGSPVGPACCCPASPAVRVVMPATATRPHSTELLLCGHHYRVSRAALAAASAKVTEVSYPSGSAPQALLPGLPVPRVAVS